ncbi:DNA-binding SARP family transcriptional activator [Streptomyces sp. TLI_55]|uniref:AfsR/SARP family transcriptional regulator n=1 Tax=Streptomyces sp. TLI_55 TaxID=1938861 RepID=UPI000BC50849|nr:BTAD domain-containing putative transcriptional regulator [Streptomyces sp. TLI_55]SNX63822.1 DNA-binding SARP family transcriptional activator [Streptomyces sp. TLI_55]
MDIQLLGCVEARVRTGERVPLAHGTKLLLAALAWSPGTFVADEVLAERVWPERLPQHPREALYIQATRLRKALGGVGQGDEAFELSRRRGGYVLVIDEQSVDTMRFRNLVREARLSARDGGIERALDLFTQALELWRGEPLSDVRTPWAETARVALRREHREALVGSAELGLRSGRVEECLRRLSRLADMHPFDEKVTGLLMLALHQVGRQADALDCFDLLRLRMVDLLGCEPGPELRALRERILARDPELVPAAAPTAAPH